MARPLILHLDIYVETRGMGAATGEEMEIQPVQNIQQNVSVL